AADLLLAAFLSGTLGIVLDQGLLFVGIDDLDLLAVQDVKDLVDVLAGIDGIRQRLVDLFIGQETLLLAKQYQLVQVLLEFFFLTRFSHFFLFIHTYVLMMALNLCRSCSNSFSSPLASAWRMASINC